MGRRVLIVSGTTRRSLLKELFESQGYAVREARRALEALRFLAAERMALILCCLKTEADLEEIKTLLRNIQMVPRLARIPCIVSTEVYPGGKDWAQLRKFGADVRLENPRNLLQAVRKITSP